MSNYKLFEHMSKEHGLLLTGSEMDEIIRIVHEITVEDKTEMEPKKSRRTNAFELKDKNISYLYKVLSVSLIEEKEWVYLNLFQRIICFLFRIPYLKRYSYVAFLEIVFHVKLQVNDVLKDSTGELWIVKKVLPSGIYVKNVKPLCGLSIGTMMEFCAIIPGVSSKVIMVYLDESWLVEKGTIMERENEKLRVLTPPERKWYKRLFQFATFGIYRCPWQYTVEQVN